MLQKRQSSKVFKININLTAILYRTFAVSLYSVSARSVSTEDHSITIYDSFTTQLADFSVLLSKIYTSLQKSSDFKSEILTHSKSYKIAGYLYTPLD